MIPNCTHSSESSSSLLFAGPASFVVIVAGLAGNLHCVRVLSRTSINTATLVSLSGLAVWDMLLLLSALLHHSLSATLLWFHFSARPWHATTVALNGLHECAHVTSTWMLIEVSAERFVAVSRPFQLFHSRREKHRRKSYARLVGSLLRLPLLMTAAACILTLPCSFEYSLEECTQEGQILQEKHSTWLLQSAAYRMLYRTLLLSLLKTFGPFIMITLLTVFTLKRMRQSMQGRAAILIEQGQDNLFFSDRDKTRSLQTISMLLLGKFLVLRCWPTAAAIVDSDVWWSWSGSERGGDMEWPGSEQGGDTAWPLERDGLAIRIAHFLLLLNSATNALVFVVLKSAFETRRLKRIRIRQREMVAKHAEQVLSIGKLLAGDKLLLLQDSTAMHGRSAFPRFSSNIKTEEA